MYQQLLKEHIDDRKAYGKLPQPPASPAELQALRGRAKQELGVDLPKEYYTLLQITNGLDSNGFVIYASETTPMVGYEGKNVFIEGIVDANLGWWDLEAHKQYVFLAESGMGLYVYDLKEGDYKSLDRQSNSLYEQFTTFEAMIARGLEENHP
jgi:hypothetical protein